jgi:hypothetical protein
MANAGLVRATHETAPDAWLPFVAYLLESFRAPGTGALPSAPTPRQIYDAPQRTRPGEARSPSQTSADVRRF